MFIIDNRKICVFYSNEVFVNVSASLNEIYYHCLVYIRKIEMLNTEEKNIVTMYCLAKFILYIFSGSILDFI